MKRGSAAGSPLEAGAAAFPKKRAKEKYKGTKSLKKGTKPVAMRIGIFVGSFDPFTIGHQSIVNRILPLFDRLVIGVGVNGSKHYMASAAQRVDSIGRLYANEPRVEVEAYSDLTVDFAHRHNAAFVVKGVRNLRDFEFERDQADINRQLTGLETLLLFAEPGLGSVSSSVVRELGTYGKDTSMFCPVPK